MTESHSIHSFKLSTLESSRDLEWVWITSKMEICVTTVEDLCDTIFLGQRATCSLKKSLFIEMVARLAMLMIAA